MRSYSLHWSIKSSLIDYVNDVSGEIELIPPVAREGGEFVFPPLSTPPSNGDLDVHTFAGEVKLVAHGGLLDIAIASPSVRIGEQQGSLDIRSRDGSLLTVATLSRPREITDGQVWEASLAATAVQLFGRTYTRGTELAPVTLVMTQQ